MYIHTMYTKNGKRGEPTEPTVAEVKWSKTKPKEIEDEPNNRGHEDYIGTT